MDTLQINVRRFYTDMNGVIQDKTTVPSAIQVKAPFYLFNQMDKEGGFRNAQILSPAVGGLFYLYSYVVGIGYNFLDFQFGNDVKAHFTNGDLIHVFGDDPTLPNFLCLIQVSCDYQSYASVLNNMKDKVFTTSSTKYFTNNTLNFQEKLQYIHQDDMGIYANDSIQPTAFLNPYLQQNSGSNPFVEITQSIELTDKKGLTSYMLFATDLLQLQFEFSSIISQFNNKTSNNGNNQSAAILFRVD